MTDLVGYRELQDRLRRRLREPLPASAAQRLMAPELSYGRHEGPPAHDARLAAVLVLFYPRQDGWWIPMTLRPVHMTEHAGQVSFPGGLAEPGETAEQTALRELQEELGVGPSQLEPLGRLSELYVYGTNYRVIPCVAATSARPAMTPNLVEVERVVELSVTDLLDESRRGTHVLRKRGLEISAPHIDCDGCHIWGATSMILAELAIVLREASRC